METNKEDYTLVGQKIRGTKIIGKEVKGKIIYWICLCSGCGRELRRKISDLLKQDKQVCFLCYHNRPKRPKPESGELTSVPLLTSIPCQICGSPSVEGSDWKNEYKRLCRRCFFEVSACDCKTCRGILEKEPDI
jgi:formylmethanofuran dehydrogenase subunit E